MPSDQPVPRQSSPTLTAKMFARAIHLPPRSRLVGWLLLFICAYRLGMPVLYSAVLAALPWLLLPAAPPDGRR